MTQVEDKRARWEHDNLRNILIACIGLQWGSEPERSLDEIRNARSARGDVIRRKLKLGRHDTVADLGSGCGFAARAIAPHVRQMYCFDISKDFLDFCSRELEEFSNVSCQLMDYARLPIGDHALDVLYATAVFIHFNFYDMVLYLREIHRTLRSGGRVLFDFLNADVIDLSRQVGFVDHLQNYPQARQTHIFNFVHPFSLRALENVAPQLGFQILDVDQAPPNASTTVILRKMNA